MSRPSTEALTSLLSEWLPSQRWFLGNGSHALVTIRQRIEIDLNTELVALTADRHGYCVPLTYDGDDAIDAADHPSGQLALLAHCLGRPVDELPEFRSIKKVTAEQSNTSIIYRFAEPVEGSAGIIMKIFRVLNAGKNPDVELQKALDAAGSHAVPRQYGSAMMDLIGTNEYGSGPAHILVAQEFLEGATEAWQWITSAWPQGSTTAPPTLGQIQELGAVTREIHTKLAELFPAPEASEEQRTAIVKSWHSRARAAIEAAPELEPYAGAVTELFEAAAKADWPELQRIHGDYHLGQVLYAQNAGWKVLDFEGEPLRSLAERNAPDLALRDVAGMLRSFSYAAGAGVREADVPVETTKNWETAAREAFLAGYGEIPEAHQALLRALILDKALYEVRYEATYRPSWLDIPLTGVRELLTN